jgi:hypothetical protein
MISLRRLLIQSASAKNLLQFPILERHVDDCLNHVIKSRFSKQPHEARDIRLKEDRQTQSPKNPKTPKPPKPQSARCARGCEIKLIN